MFAQRVRNLLNLTLRSKVHVVNVMKHTANLNGAKKFVPNPLPEDPGSKVQLMRNSVAHFLHRVVTIATYFA